MWIIVDQQTYFHALIIFLKQSSLKGEKGELWSTFSLISGLKFGIIFGADLTGPLQVGPTAAGFGSEVMHYILMIKSSD